MSDSEHEICFHKDAGSGQVEVKVRVGLELGTFNFRNLNAAIFMIFVMVVEC